MYPKKDPYLFRTKKAFTLIELLVVLVILSLLTTLSTFSIVWYIASSRDSRRIIDLQSISTALDLYYKKNSYTYPVPTGYVGILYSSGASTLTGAWLGNMTEDKLPDLWQMPVDPKNKTYYLYGETPDSKKYEIASRLEKYDNGQGIFANGITNDPSIFGNNIYIIGNYRQDVTNSYYLKGLIMLSGSSINGLTTPTSSLNVGTFNSSTNSIDYTGSGVVIQKTQTTY